MYSINHSRKIKSIVFDALQKILPSFLHIFIFGKGEDPGITDEYGVGNDRFIDGYYPEKTEGISTY